MFKLNTIFINKKGEKVFEHPYQAMDFKEDLCRVIDSKQQYGFVNKNGDVIIPLQAFGGAWDFSEGLARVGRAITPYTKPYDLKPTNLGFINKKGERVIDVKGKNTGEFREGLASVENNDGNWIFINQENDIVIPPIGSWYGDNMWSIPHFREGLAPVRLNEQWGFINKDGDVVIEPMFDSPSIVREGLIAVKKDKKWGYIDTSGSWVVEPQYEKAWPFYEDRALVMLPTGHLYAPSAYDKWKFLDKTGNIAIGFEDCNYRPVHDGNFSEGLAPVKLRDDWGFIDLQGNLVIEPQFQLNHQPHFSEGLALVKKNGPFVYIDQKGSVAFKVETDVKVLGAFNFSEGLARLSYSD